MSKLLFVCALSAIVSVSFGLSCKSLTANSVKTFTTQDATIVSQIAYIAEFELICDGPDQSAPIFAEFDGQLSPVSRTAANQFQVSWTKDVKKASRGDHVIRLFNEEGFAAVRKAHRSGADTSSVKPLAEVVVNHSGAFNGPYVNSEILAAGLSILVAYVAFSTKSKLLS